jgi:hypothetical protein
MSNNEITMQQRLKEIVLMGQAGAEHLGELLHRQHYDFAHKTVPYVIENHFDTLISSVSDGTIQEWIFQIWNNSGDDVLVNYSIAVHPDCKFLKISEDIGVIYFVMPAPRPQGETLYTAIVFLMDEDLPSTWLRRYFTLELGSYVPSTLLENGNSSVHWTFAEWADSCHLNRGSFKFQPTLENFLGAAVNEAESTWY